MTDKKTWPSGFWCLLQIRWGGAKGVVSLDLNLWGRQLVLRKSMVKFEAPHHRMLEVCLTAGRIPYYLNRQAGADGHWDAGSSIGQRPMEVRRSWLVSSRGRLGR